MTPYCSAPQCYAGQAPPPLLFPSLASSLPLAGKDTSARANPPEVHCLILGKQAGKERAAEL